MSGFARVHLCCELHLRMSCELVGAFATCVLWPSSRIRFSVMSNGDAEKRCERGFEGASDLLKVQDRDVAFAAFNGADEGAVKVALLAEFFLRQSRFRADFADAVAQSLQKAFVLEIHG